jgi:hypothetical protein
VIKIGHDVSVIKSFDGLSFRLSINAFSGRVQMDASSVPIAIGEPIGGGLFASNATLAAVILCSRGREGVRVEPAAFWRDAGSYAASVALVAGICLDGKVCCRGGRTACK